MAESTPPMTDPAPSRRGSVPRGLTLFSPAVWEAVS